MAGSFATAQGLVIGAYPGDDCVLIAYDLGQSLTEGLAGFAVERTSPDGENKALLNRLHFGTGPNASTSPD